MKKNQQKNAVFTETVISCQVPHSTQMNSCLVTHGLYLKLLKSTSWIRHFFTPGLNSNLLPFELIKKVLIKKECVKPNFTVVQICIYILFTYNYLLQRELKTSFSSRPFRSSEIDFIRFNITHTHTHKHINKYIYECMSYQLSN